MPELNIIEKAEQLLLSNIIKGTYRDTKYFYVRSSANKYHHHVLWDSSFHQIVLSYFKPEYAKKDLLCYLEMQQSNGFLPHMIYWEQDKTMSGLAEKITSTFHAFLYSHPRMSKLTQPPVIAFALEEVYKRTNDKKFLNKAYPKVKKFYDYLARERDPDKDGLVSIIHSWETGIDASPAYDSVYKLKGPSRLFAFYWNATKLLFKYKLLNWDLERIFNANLFCVEDLSYNCIYAFGLRALSRLAKELDKKEDFKHYKELADRVEDAIIKNYWNEEDKIFYNVDKEGNKIKSKTIISLFPLILENIDKEKVDCLVKHIINRKEFRTPYPVPSVAVSEESFEPDYHGLLWRGPTWVNINWFLAHGLNMHGYKILAKILTSKTKEMVEKSGYWEFYNPFNAKGEGAKDFCWSTLVVDMIKKFS